MTDQNRRTAALDHLPAAYRVLHDVPFPGSRVNIHHVVVGPAGVFTIHVHDGEVTIKGDHATSERRDLRLVITHVRDAKDAIARATGAKVVPIICGQGGMTVRGLFQKPEVRRVAFCAEGQLTSLITERPEVLSTDGIADLVATVEQSLGRHSPT